jgi:hypothetical protein
MNGDLPLRRNNHGRCLGRRSPPLPRVGLPPVAGDSPANRPEVAAGAFRVLGVAGNCAVPFPRRNGGFSAILGFGDACPPQCLALPATAPSRHKFPEMPWLVVRPMRALISWIATING